MDDHKRRFVTSGDEDIITNLSEDLIDPILERLPVKDAVRTSVLSKKWRYRWTTIRTLDFGYQFSNQFLKVGAFSQNGFIRVISQIMIHHNGPILKFVLRIPKQINFDSFQEVDRWMLILSRNNFRELQIKNSNRIYQIPSSVFSCLELGVLGFSNCVFKPPLEFQGFPNLEELCLLYVHFESNLGGTVINLPRLKHLTLYSSDNFNNFNIKAEKLQTLRIDSCPDAILLRLLHSEHLHAVKICLPKSLEDFIQVESFSFTIDGYFLKFLAAEKFSKWPPHAIQFLRRLNFQSFSFGDLDQLQPALCMLRNSPNLEVLRVTHMPMGPEADLELASSCLESPDGLDKTLFKLQTVEMTAVEGSRPELLFIKLLLDHSPNLENMIIRPMATADAQKMLNIAKDVMMFPRASSKAKMACLDSEP